MACVACASTTWRPTERTASLLPAPTISAAPPVCSTLRPRSHEEESVRKPFMAAPDAHRPPKRPSTAVPKRCSQAIIATNALFAKPSHGGEGALASGRRPRRPSVRLHRPVCVPRSLRFADQPALGIQLGQLRKPGGSETVSPVAGGKDGSCRRIQSGSVCGFANTI